MTSIGSNISDITRQLDALHLKKEAPALSSASTTGRVSSSSSMGSTATTSKDSLVVKTTLVATPITKDPIVTPVPTLLVVTPTPTATPSPFSTSTTNSVPVSTPLIIKTTLVAKTITPTPAPVSTPMPMATPTPAPTITPTPMSTPSFFGSSSSENEEKEHKVVKQEVKAQAPVLIKSNSAAIDKIQKIRNQVVEKAANAIVQKVKKVFDEDITYVGKRLRERITPEDIQNEGIQPYEIRLSGQECILSIRPKQIMIKMLSGVILPDKLDKKQRSCHNAIFSKVIEICNSVYPAILVELMCTEENDKIVNTPRASKILESMISKEITGVPPSFKGIPASLLNCFS